MGTLFEQPLRAGRIPAKTSDDIMTELNDLMKEYQGLTFKEAISVIELAMKRTEADSRILDRDIKDEQLMGFGELFRELIEVLRSDNDEEVRLSLVK